MTGTWREALAALDVPPGVPGSGRQRYGAAMTLWREGLIPPEVLEVYRVASPLDGQDPVPMLAAAGLPRPGSEIAALVAASRRLIASLSFAGQEDVLVELRVGGGVVLLLGGLVLPECLVFLPQVAAGVAVDLEDQ